MRERGLILLLLVAALCGALAAAENGPSAWDILRRIVLVPGVSGHEGPAADFIRGALPPRVKAERDGMNNVWFTAGSGKPHILFVAHSDELGWTVDRITAEGRLKLKGSGGILPQAAEAHAVLVHTARRAVAGIVAPRPGYDERRPDNAPAAPYPAESFEIVLGVSSEKEARDLGVAEGDPVTAKKTVVDFAPGLMATRAVDDRAGCAALLAAALRVDWGRIKDRTVTFAWDVQEETGLFGAAELAKRLKPDYVFAVDTFVSTDSPLESRRFAYAVIGRGAVIRAIDSSSVVPQGQLRKVLDLAARRGIPVQVGSSRGGNDGSVFLAGGSVDIPLSWPGAYAHSLIEKIDRRDLEALTDLILALVDGWR
jgi:putative aminopeptidase FrvX